MPILWRLVLSWYLKLFTLACASLLSLLLATRLHDIASLATLGMSWQELGLYSLYQIPYILPIAVAFAAFLASLLMGRFLLRGPELIGLAACRMPLRELILPVASLAFLLSLANFYFVSELSTRSHLKGMQMIQELQRTSPLILLKQPHMVDRGHFAAFAGSSKSGVSHDFTFVFFQTKQQRLGLIKADEIGMEGTSIVAKNMLLLGSKASNKGFDDLWIENIGKTRASGDLFAWLGNSTRRISPDHLDLNLLASAYHGPTFRNKPKLLTEVGRRIAFSAAPFILALFGLAFALDRRPRRQTVPFWPTLLALCSIASIFASKAVESKTWLAWTLQLGPLLLLLLLAGGLLYARERGRVS